jgi:exodeoxyribonuclease VIII
MTKLNEVIDLPFYEYQAKPGLSNSQLSTFKQSPAHYKYFLEHPKAETASMRLGRAQHAAILTPQEFLATYRTRPEGLHANSKAYKELNSDVQSRGLTMLTDSDIQRCKYMTDSVFNHKTASSLLSRPSIREGSIFSDKPNAFSEDLLLKGRFDCFLHEDGILVDLKTTQNAGEEFQRSMNNYGYHRQGAFYLELLRNSGYPDASVFLIIAVESLPPYGCAVYEVANRALNQGAKELSELVVRYKRCITTENWDAYGNDIISLDLPKYAYETNFSS